MSTANTTFFSNDVLTDDFDFSLLEERGQDSKKEPVPLNGLASTVAAIATSALLVFGPVGMYVPGPGHVESVRRQVVVHVQAPGAVPHVAVPDNHKLAAARLKRLFKPVPLSDAEKLPDPDYGL